MRRALITAGVVLLPLLMGTSAPSQAPEEEIKVDEGRSLAEAVVAISARTRVRLVARLPGLPRGRVVAVTPLALAGYGRRLARQRAAWWQSRGRTATLLEGRLAIHFLGGAPSALVPILFGERFTAIRYGSLFLDPGGRRMARGLRQHLRRLAPGTRIAHVVPTHAHEEHAGNLELAARLTGAAIRAHPRALPFLRRPPRLPRMRALVIGQPRPLAAPVEPLGDTLAVGPGAGDVVQVVEPPGHSAEHVALDAPRDRLLLAGDAFMGTHFSVPNDDVDHAAWEASLERLAALDVEILVEGHGHVHTERPDVLADLARQGLSAVASRARPRDRLAAKLDFVRWVGDQVRLGRAEGLPARSLQATVFPGCRPGHTSPPFRIWWQRR